MEQVDALIAEHNAVKEERTATQMALAISEDLLLPLLRDSAYSSGGGRCDRHRRLRKKNRLALNST
jgi:hypothetical protein